MNTTAFKIISVPLKATLVFTITITMLLIVHWLCAYFMNTYYYYIPEENFGFNIKLYNPFYIWG